MGNAKNVDTLTELERLTNVLSLDTEQRLKLADRLLRDAQLQVDALQEICHAQRELDALGLQQRAHELFVRANQELQNDNLDTSLAVRLLLLMNITDGQSSKISPDTVRALLAVMREAPPAPGGTQGDVKI